MGLEFRQLTFLFILLEARAVVLQWAGQLEQLVVVHRYSEDLLGDRMTRS